MYCFNGFMPKEIETQVLANHAYVCNTRMSQKRKIWMAGVGNVLSGENGEVV